MLNNLLSVFCDNANHFDIFLNEFFYQSYSDDNSTCTCYPNTNFFQF